MKSLRVIAPIVLFGAVACGTEGSDLDVTLEAPAPAEAKVSISAALEVSDLLDSGLADRVVIDDITVNLAEVRLLAADPRIPPGGLNLLSKATLLEFYGAEESKLELPFPEQFLSQDDLAVYLHIAPSDALESSSIVITGRYYAAPVNGQKPLTADNGDKGAQDPDTDPVMPDEDRRARENDDDPRVQAQNPDTDPVDPGSACAQDPDTDPVMCARHMLTSNTEQSVAFELHTADIADLVATLGNETELNVVVGIPASRWFTDEVIENLNRALAKEASSADSPEENKRADRDVIVVESDQRATSERMKDGRDDYFVTNRDLDELTVRR